MKEKPIVHYDGEVVNRIVGQSAFLVPIDHPSDLVSNTKMVRTSTIVKVEDNGQFETQNTVYKPMGCNNV